MVHHRGTEARRRKIRGFCSGGGVGESASSESKAAIACGSPGREATGCAAPTLDIDW